MVLIDGERGLVVDGAAEPSGGCRALVGFPADPAVLHRPLANSSDRARGRSRWVLRRLVKHQGKRIIFETALTGWPTSWETTRSNRSSLWGGRAGSSAASNSDRRPSRDCERLSQGRRDCDSPRGINRVSPSKRLPPGGRARPLG